MKHNLKTRLLSLLLCASMMVSLLAHVTPVKSADGEGDGEEKKTTISDLTAPFRPDVEFVINGETLKSQSYRIPTMVTLDDGTIVAAADIRWNTTYDGGGLDTLVARSTDGGKSWQYTVANYLGDNGNEYNALSSTFIDPNLLVGADGHTVYMLVDLYAYGVALNGNGQQSFPTSDTGFTADGYLALSSNNRASFGYYLKDGKIWANGATEPLEGYSVDAYFNITGPNGEKGNLFCADSPFQVAKTQFLYLIKSIDGGATWSEPSLLNLRKPAGTTPKNTDEDALLVAPAGSVTTSKGVMVFPVYSYAHYTTYNSMTASYQHMGLIYSTDGVNWERTENFTELDFSSEGSVIELQNGNLRVFFRNDQSRLCYADYDLEAKKWLPYEKTEIRTNSNTQLSAITYSRTSDGKQVVLVSCPSGPTNKDGINDGNGSWRTNGKIHVFIVNEDGSMTEENTIDHFTTPATGQLSDPNYLEEQGFFAYSALTEGGDGSILLMYENNQFGWGAGDGKYFTITIKGHTADALGIKRDDPQNTIVDANGNRIDSVTMGQFEKPEIAAQSPFNSADVKYQWQIEYEDGKWVDIYGETSKTVKISYGMVATLLSDDGKVDIRCKSQSGTSVAYSKPITVTIEMYQPEEPDVVVSESLTTTSGEVVTVTIAGSIPEDASVQLEEAEPEGVNVGASETVMASLDISIKNADGTEWQPESGDTVTVTLEASKLGLKDGDTFVVYHLHEGEVKIIGAYTVENDTVSFEVDGFSLFVFALAEQTLFTDDLQSDIGKTATINDAYDYFSAVADPTVEEQKIAQEGKDYAADIEFIIADVYVSGTYPYNIYYKVEVKNGELLSDFVNNYPWIYQGQQDEDPSFATLILQDVPEEPAEPEVSISVDGEPVSEISVSSADKVTLSAALNVEGTTTYQWQLLIPAANMWVNISGQTSAECTVNYGMVANRLDSDGKAHVRCVTTVDGTEIISEAIAVKIAEAVAYSVRPVACVASTSGSVYGVMPAAEEDIYIVTVYYYIGDSTVMEREVYPMKFGVNEQPKTTVFPIPAKEGYTAYYFSENANTGKENGIVYTATEYTLSNFKPTADMNLYVRYYPNEDTQYKVQHHFQNVYDDKYTINDEYTQILTGTTDTKVPGFNEEDSLALDEATLLSMGFYATPYQRETIASDGSTVINIYYDRFMYLLLFDLGEGGTGVEPTYGRHGVEYTVNEPKRLGYSFTGWTDWDGNVIPKTSSGQYTFTIPPKDVTVTANWTADDTNYTLVFWRADLDDGDASTPTTYSYWGRTTIGAISGDTIYPQSVGTNYPAEDNGGTYFDNSEAPYFNYDAEKTATSNPASVEVSGDGSTIVNVFYNRKIFEIRYNYARKSGNNVQLAYYTTNGHIVNGWYTGGVGDNLPTLNDSSLVTKTETISGYTYYYISVRAEYGANIELQWPAAVVNSLTYNRTTYTFGSWATENDTGYRNNDPNHANIVGSYPYMSKDMIKVGNEDNALIDADTGETYYVAQRMSAWWDMQNTVSNHTYHIYYEVLDGVGDREYNGKQYKLVKTLDFVAAHNGDTRVDPFYYNGYICVNDTRGQNNSNLNSRTDYQKNSNNYQNTTTNKNAGRYNCPNRDQCEYCNCFYYDRESYQLSFYNHNEATNNAGKTFAPAELKFEVALSDGLPEGVTAPYKPAYPEGLDVGGYAFGGWYTTDQFIRGTEVDWGNDQMPASDVTLYAKWAPVEHKIEFYFDESCQTKLINTTVDGNTKFTDQTVLHNEYGNDPGLPGHPMDFDAVTWFYKDANGEEKTFTFDMQVKQDMKLYPKWRTTVYIDYEIYFKYYDRENNNFTDIDVAAPIYDAELYGQTVTVDPKATEELYAEYQKLSKGGYFPMTGSHSIVMGEQSCSVSIPDSEKFFKCEWNEEEGKHIFTFYYVNGPMVPYTVEYHALKANGTFDKVLGTKMVNDNYFAKIVENAPYYAGYSPDVPQKTIFVVYGQENKIIFYYSPDTSASFYRVNHYIQKFGDAGYSLYDWEEFASRVGDKINDYPPLVIPGVTYTHTEIIPGDKTVGESVNGNPGLTVNLYYEETGATINYVVKDNFGGTVNVATETIGAYYGTVNGSQATANSNVYKFVGWYTDEACTTQVPDTWVGGNGKLVPQKTGSLWTDTTYYAKFEYNLTSLTINKAFPIGADYSMDINQSFLFDVVEVDENGKVINDGVNLTVTVHGEDSITIDGLTVGCYYKITEQTDWSWRYKECVPSSGLADATVKDNSITVQLTAVASANKVTFTNTRTNDQWLDGDSYKVNIFDGNN